MALSQSDLRSLSVDDRLDLIDRLWLSIATDAKLGDQLARKALDLRRPLEPETLAELHRRADALERNPSNGIRWEDLKEELKKKYG